jgi:hypothetical protein
MKILLWCTTPSYILFLKKSETHAESLLRGLAENRDRQLVPVDDTFIFNEESDGYATGIGDKVGTPCYTDGRWVR